MDAFEDPDGIPDIELGEGPTQPDFVTLLSPSERIMICQGLKEAVNVMERHKMNLEEKSALHADILQLLGITIIPESEEKAQNAAKFAGHFENLTREQLLKANENVVVVDNRRVWPNPLS